MKHEATSFTFHHLGFPLSNAVQATTDGQEVTAEIEAIEADERDKRILKLTKAHRKAWYAAPRHGDVAFYLINKDTHEAAIANRMADGEIRWRITGLNMSKSFADFAGYLVDHKVDPSCVLRLTS